MQHLYKIYPMTEQEPLPEYKFNWLELFLVMACIGVTVTVVYNGIQSLLQILAGI